MGVGGNHTAETQARISKTVPKLGWVANLRHKAEGNKRRIKYSVRLRVTKTVVKGVLSSFAKSPKTSGQGGATSPCGSHARMSEVPKDFIWGTFIIEILVEAQATQT